jgi:hypothetical protein
VTPDEKNPETPAGNEQEVVYIELRPTNGSWLQPPRHYETETEKRFAKYGAGGPGKVSPLNLIEMAEIEGDVFFRFTSTDPLAASNSGLCIDGYTMDQLAILWCRIRRIDPNDSPEITRVRR